MGKYSKEFKELAQLRSDERRSKKVSRAAGNQLLRDCRQEEGEKPKSAGSEGASDKTPLNERELAMQQEIQALKKARFNCGNKIILPHSNATFPHRKLAY